MSYAQVGRQMASGHTHIVMDLPRCRAGAPFSLWPLWERWVWVPMNVSAIAVNEKTDIYKNLMNLMKRQILIRI